MHTLEERLSGLEHAKQDLVQHFLSPMLVPRYWNCSYLKCDLICSVKDFLKNQKVRLREKEGNQYGQINRTSWEALKRVEYGRLNAQGMHAGVFRRLTDFETIYFLAGLWRKKSAKDPSKRFSEEILDATPIKVTVARMIAEGAYLLEHTMKEEGKTQKPPFMKKIIPRCKQVVEYREVPQSIVQDEDEYSLSVNPEQLSDLAAYLRNCDRLSTKPTLYFLFDEERTHPINSFIPEQAA
ncbi:hypothetical protein HZA97_04735 [Candidatus Woesearchaeota archaeon]|nr:hypothetical protein [Candidatus Woesearchaeota archaeon]